MDLARVIGHVVASVKDPALEGVKLSILEPLNEDLSPAGDPLIATDAVSRRDVGELVFFVASGDAVFTARDASPLPSDAAVMGSVDQVFVDERERRRLHP